MERTLILVKPNGVQRGLIGMVISTLEKKGLCLLGLKFFYPSRELLEEHGIEKEEPYFSLLVDHMLTGPVLAMVWEGNEAIKVGRLLIGETEHLKYKPGTIRGNYNLHIGRNIVHGSDSKDAAAKEIPLWFKQEELIRV